MFFWVSISINNNLGQKCIFSLNFPQLKPSEIQEENSTLTPELTLFSTSILKLQLSFIFPFVSKTLEIDFQFVRISGLPNALSRQLDSRFYVWAPSSFGDTAHPDPEDPLPSISAWTLLFLNTFCRVHHFFPDASWTQ